MPVTDILNPTTVITNNAAVSSANALAVKVISGGASGITVDTTAITGGTTTRLLYDNGGTVGETAAVTYASASVTMAFSSLGVLGFKSSASVVDGGLSRLGAAIIGAGNGTAGDVSGTFQAGPGNGSTPAFMLASGLGIYNLNGLVTVAAGGGPALQVNGSTLRIGSVGVIGWSGSTPENAFDTGLVRSAAGSVAVVGSGAAIAGTVLASNAVLTGTLGYGGITFASTVTGSGSLVGATNPTLSSLIATGTLTYGGVTLASTVTGTGSMVLATTPTFSSAGTTTIAAGGTLTYGGVTLSSTVTGTGSMVLSASPTLSGTASFAATAHSGLATFSSAMVYGGVTLSSTVTGTGSMVLSAAPSITGNATFVSAAATGVFTTQNGVAASATGANVAIQYSSTASFGIQWGALGSVAPTVAATQGCIYINTTGSTTAQRMYIKVSAAGTWTAFTTAA